MIKRIREYIPNEPIQFKKNIYTDNLEIHFINKKEIMTILEDNNWEEIKRHIDVKLSSQRLDECSICYTKEALNIRRVTCTKCASEFCIDCYIQIFRKNKGIIKCPFCRFTYGQEFPIYMIEEGVRQILDTL